MIRGTWRFISILVVALAIWGVVGAWGGDGEKEPEEPAILAPDFTLQSLDGKRYTLSELRGKVVILNFWATWCAPCRKEIPDLSRIYTAHKDHGLIILGISWDELSKDRIRKFAENYKVSYPVLHGTQSELIQVGQAYQWEGYLPTTYLIDREGYLKEVFVGARSETFLLKRIEALL